MGYVSTWPNAKIIGKKSIYESESKSIELPELKVEKSVEGGANVPKVTEEASHTEGLSGDQTTIANSLMVESKPSENDQPLTKKEGQEDGDVTVTLYLCFFYTHLSLFFGQFFLHILFFFSISFTLISFIYSILSFSSLSFTFYSFSFLLLLLF